jgi:cytochrome c
MVHSSTLLLLIALIASSMDIGASPAQQSLQKGDQAPIRPGSPMSGLDIFEGYCAACHGKNAKGMALPLLAQSPATRLKSANSPLVFLFLDFALSIAPL